jgi:hypothetical protein
MVEKIFQTMDGLPNRRPITERQCEFEYDKRLTPEENAEIEDWCNDPTGCALAVDIDTFEENKSKRVQETDNYFYSCSRFNSKDVIHNW